MREGCFQRWELSDILLPEGRACVLLRQATVSHESCNSVGHDFCADGVLIAMRVHRIGRARKRYRIFISPNPDARRTTKFGVQREQGRLG